MSEYELLTKKMFLEALGALDQELAGAAQKIKLIVGGGGAMILAHSFPLSTTDLDAVPIAISPSEIDAAVKAVAKKLNLPPDWLNPYFSTFTHTLPADYGSRLITVFDGKNISAQALGREDLLIMKCFAGRTKDIAHARALVKAGADVEFAEKHIETLRKKRIPGADKALDFLDEILGEL